MNPIREYLRKDRNQIRMLAESLLAEEMPVITEELFGLFEKNGNRLQFEEVYFTRRKFLTVYGMELILEKEKEHRMLEKLEQVIWDICGEVCWELPAHVNRKSDPDWPVTAALFACETAQTLSALYSMLGGVLQETTKEKIRSEVQRRVLTPFFESSFPYRNWEDCHHNWAAVCGGSIGSALLYLDSEKLWEKDGELDRVHRALECYLQGFSEDGACMEGLGYFGYGMTYFVGLCAQIYELSKGKIDWLDNERCHRIALFPQKCFFRSGMAVPFSDGSREESYKLGVMCYLAGHFKDVRLPDVERAAEFTTDSCYRFQAVWMDYFLTKQYLETNPETCDELASKGGKRTGQRVFPAAQWSICESDNGVAFAMKGGCNDEPHNHNDVGSFCLFAGSEMLLADLGAGEYTKDYFSDRRYTIFCNQSLSHNVPVVAGIGQAAGAQFRAQSFETDGQGMTRISFAGAYAPECGLERLTRTCQFDLQTGELLLEDVFSFPKGAGKEKEENFVSIYPIRQESHKLVIQGEEYLLQMESDAMDEKVKIETVHHSDHIGQDILVYRARVMVQQEIDTFQVRCSVHRKKDRI